MNIFPLTTIHLAHVCSSCQTGQYSLIPFSSNTSRNLPGRVVILHLDCKDEIVNSPLREDTAVGLPLHLRLVSTFLLLTTELLH